MSIDDLTNAIRREVERQLAGRYNTRTGLVTSYDPKTHSAKVMLKPDNTETGWLPIRTDHIGNGFGILVGPTPGDGKKTGDQVEVTFTEGDLEQGRVMHRVHSDTERPPPVESGEILVKHEKGGSLFWSKDGKITITGGKGQADQNQQNTPPTAISKPGAPGSGLDPQSQDAASGQTIVFDTDGNITHTGIKGQITIHDKDGNIKHTGVKGQTVLIDKDGNIKLDAKNTDDNTKGDLVSSAAHDITHAAQNNISQTAQQAISRTALQAITDTGSSLVHNGPTSVTGTLGVTQMLSANGGLGGLGGIGNFSNDAAAALGGVSIGQAYRTASALMVRVS
jgi:phage baseplate assembly protein gpV